MLILTEKNPEKSLYFIGSKLLSFFMQRDKAFLVLELYDALIAEIKVGFNRFLLALDWLYMLGAIDLNQEGRVEKCF